MPIRTLAVAALAVMLTVGACSSGTEPAVSSTRTEPPATSATSATSASRPTADRDELVTTSAGRMHLRCVGAGSTTIVLVAGWGDGGDSWGPVESALGDEARVCSYARLGTGTSDPPATDQTFDTQAAALAELLATAGEAGPYVLVGHSFGGAVSLAFADAHRETVEGLVLLDATPVDWIDAACAVPDDGSEAAASFVAACAMASSPARNPERLDAVTSFHDVADITDLGDVPIAVLYPSDVPYGDLATDEQDRLRGIKIAGMRRWASLSSTATIVPVDRTSHYIQTDRPDAAVAAIEGVLG